MSLIKFVTTQWLLQGLRRGSRGGRGGGQEGKAASLGSFPEAVQAARAYDRAALKIRGPTATLNIPAADYAADKFLQVRHNQALP